MNYFSNCCGAVGSEVVRGMGICPDCKEHCDFEMEFDEDEE